MLKTINSPRNVKKKFPVVEEILKNIASYRRTIRNILDFEDPRMLVIVGPCSFHDPDACMEYAHLLKKLANEVSETMVIAMRVYVEKPRTDLGWKGYLNDPYLDESHCISEGINIARQFMLDVNALGLPIASEVLNPMSYLYFEDLLSWACIGARTVESQQHREIASGLSMPVGVKNTTSGNIHVALNSISCISHKQIFLGMNAEGRIDVIHTRGNPYAHLVLRGSEHGGNYNKADISNAEKMLSTLKIPGNIIVDCSHGNSIKNHLNQEIVLNEIFDQKSKGNQSIVGVILESFLEAGHQAIPNDINQLQYGCSITDSCLGWDETYRIIKTAHERLMTHDFSKRFAIDEL